jgi:small subunit ribosomal protein S8e
MPKSHHGLTKRRSTGAKRRALRKKRLYERGSDPSVTTLGPTRRISSRTRGGSSKERVLSTQYANVADPATNTVQRVQIDKVESNPSNRDYDRRGIITKGAVIETELGSAEVTSRTGQDGTVNAKLVQS